MLWGLTLGNLIRLLEHVVRYDGLFEAHSYFCISDTQNVAVCKVSLADLNTIKQHWLLGCAVEIGTSTYKVDD